MQENRYQKVAKLNREPLNVMARRLLEKADQPLDQAQLNVLTLAKWAEPQVDNPTDEMAEGLRALMAADPKGAMLYLQDLGVTPGLLRKETDPLEAGMAILVEIQADGKTEMV